MTQPRRLYGLTELKGDYTKREVLTKMTEPDQANVIISQVQDDNVWQSGHEALHMPCIDFDFECELVPSRTPGHFHLYLNKAIPWERYKTVLLALADAGLIELEYYQQSCNNGFSTLRTPPWEDRYQQLRQQLEETGEFL